jgi:predicted Zn-ribbon and HTH transcriptional regulator
MTFEDRTTLELSDIQTLRFECTACGVGLTFPAAQSIRIPVECPSCKAQWMGTHETDYVSIQHLVQAIRYLRSPGDTAAYRLRLELQRPAEAASGPRRDAPG